MWITYSVLSCKLARSSPTFSLVIFSGKKGKLLWRLCKSSGYWISTSRKYPSSLSSVQLFIKLSSNSEISSNYLISFTDNFFWRTNYLQRYLRYDSSLFSIIILRVIVISFNISIYSMTYSTSDTSENTFFYHKEHIGIR